MGDEQMFHNQSQLLEKWEAEIEQLLERRAIEKRKNSQRVREIDNMIEAYQASIAKLTQKGFSNP